MKKKKIVHIPEYKRLAAFQGDYIMSAHCRFFTGASRVDAECPGLV
jgi:hypothetical protein